MSQISAREDSKSHAARDHWIAERLFDWSGVPTVHIRPTFFSEWTVFPTTPQRVDYELTKLGSTLWEAVEPLSSWARAHVSEILTSRERFDGKDAG
jgi:uncharacterized protein YbjT (DUF2867 family)